MIVVKNKILMLTVIALSLSLSLSQQLFSADTLFDKRFERWKKQASQGDKRAQYKLGVSYLRGNEVKVNIPEAIKWFTKSAKQNYVKAAHKLGLIYYNNKDGNKNYKRGFRWFLKAANKKYAPSQYYVGKMYLEARGVKQDLERALLWAKRAENQQLIKAQNLIGSISEAMGGGKTKKRKPKIEPKKLVKRSPKIKKNNTNKNSTAGKARPDPKQNPPLNSIATLFATQKIVTKSKWLMNGKPAEHMPSSLTRCQPAGNTIKCITGRLKGETSSYTAHYQVQTTLSDFKPTGTFNLKYRKNFIFVLPEDPDDPSPDEDSPALGWQKSHSNLRCRVLSKNKMHCFTDEFKVERFTK